MLLKKGVLNFLIPALLTLVFYFSSYILSTIRKSEPDYSAVATQIQRHFSKMEKKLSALISEIINNPNIKQKNFNTISQIIKEHNKKNLFSFFVFSDNEIIYWSDNSIPINQNEYKILNADKNLIELSNGYYYCLLQKSENITVVALFCIFNKYPYQNRFLSSGFAEFSNLKIPALLTTDKIEKTAVFNSENQFLFSVLPSPQQKNNSLPFSFVFLTFLLSICCFFLAVSNFPVRNFYKAKILIPLILFIAVIFRVIQIFFQIPKFIYNEELFTPLHYAWKTGFASLGDLFTHIFIFFIISLIFYFKFSDKAKYIQTPRNRIYLMTMLAVLLLLVFIALNLLTETLIINSSLMLNFDNILKMKSVDFLGFMVIVIMFVSFLYLSFITLQLIRKNLKFSREIIIFFILFFLFSFVLGVVLYRFIFPLILFVLFFTVVVSVSHKHFKLTGGYGICCFLLFTVTFGYAFNKFNQEKEQNHRKLYAVKLSEEQDPIGEYLFAEISEKIKADSFFVYTLSNDDAPQSFAEEYIRKNYLDGYFSKYHIQVTVCASADKLLILPANVEVMCYDFFEDMKLSGKPTMTDDLWLINTQTGKPTYLFHFRFLSDKNHTSDSLNLFLEMLAIPKITGLGYPELLVEEKVLPKTTHYNYVYAKYFNNELVTKFGDYPYDINLASEMSKQKIDFVEMNNYSHLIFPVTEKSTVIVGLQLKKPFEKLSTYSYLLIAFVIFHYIILLIIALLQKTDLFQMFAFKTRLQLACVSLVIICFIISGIIATNFFIKYNNNKNSEIIREKSFSLFVELQHKLENYEELTSDDYNFLNELLVKFSNVFFTDINLFSTSGHLIATSRPQIYQQGLISTYINPQAYEKLYDMNTSYFLQNEAIGKLNFTSSYMPFINYKNNVIAFLNLPYFAREDELQKEISGFLINFINFYAILIAIAVIVALITANYIVLPLKIIGQKLRSLKPGTSNEKISWTRQDDIGILVGEYNRMVDELAESTRMLMEAERETAWAEMAKQIAHEIKNPLTPMKLNIQNLQRAWKDKSPDFNERLSLTTQTLTEQIDTLAKIASEFANFAKIQPPILEPVNLIPIINDIINLYKNEQINISLKYNTENSYTIMADASQIIQIMNNILKNAVQAIPTDIKGNIEISADKNLQKILITVKDNGCGIPDDIKHKIFSPNFTLKSGGTGLGLAISKKIISNLGGNISFESQTNKGTTFYITFPEYTE